MPPPILQLEERARQALASAFRQVPAGGGPVQVALPKGSAGMLRDQEVFVLVLGPDGGLAVRKALVKGRASWREVRLRFLGAEAAVEGLADQAAALGPPLTTAETSLLDEAGLGEGPEGPGALERSGIDYAVLLSESFTLEEAAKRLRVSGSRLRQRLSKRTLYGIKDGRSWKIPRFQFDAARKKLVRGLDVVLPRIRASAHPLAVVRWLTSPHSDLVVEAEGSKDEEEAASPLAWLQSGRDPKAVAELADEV